MSKFPLKPMFPVHQGYYYLMVTKTLCHKHTTMANKIKEGRGGSNFLSRHFDKTVKKYVD